VPNRLPLRIIGVLVAAGATVLGVQPSASAHDHSTVVVSAGGGGDDCRHPDATSIQQGVSLARPGGTVLVCAGTYKESVTITTPRLTLRGRHGATIDATGQSYGIGIGADNVTVTGMTVHNAGNGLVTPETAQAICGSPPNNGVPQPLCAGIVTFVVGQQGPVPGNYLTITENRLTGNAGFGIDVVSTKRSLIEDNEADRNGVVGINVVDDLNVPVRDNRIVGNDASDNRSGCGIALASHSGAGVIGNLVKDNEADRNGLANGGAGVLLATPTPGAVVKDNTLTENSASGNGHAGVEVHIHVGQNATDQNGNPAPTPNADVSGNRIIGNDLGRNNRLGDFGTDSPIKTVGVYIGSNSPLTIVVKGNDIHDDDIGIFQAGKQVTTVRPDANRFRHVGQPFVAITAFA
jgi:parallel beta-helix repeat protein